MFVPAVGEETTLVLPGGKPALLGVPVTVNMGGVGVGFVLGSVPPGGKIPAALVAVALGSVVGVVQGTITCITECIRVVFNSFDNVIIAPPIGGFGEGNGIIDVGVGTIGVGVGTIGVGVGTIGVGTIGVGVGTIGVGVGTIGVGVGTIGVGVDTIGVGVGTTGVFVAQPTLKFCATTPCANAFPDNKNTTPTNVNSQKTQRNRNNLCNVVRRCLASFRARTYTYF